MYDVVSIKTAKKLKKVGVQQIATLFFYRPYLIVDKNMYSDTFKTIKNLVNIKNLINIKDDIWCLALDNFKPTPVTITNIPKRCPETLAAFNLSELIKIYGEDIKIPHNCKNYTEYVATKLIENITEVNNTFKF